MRLPARIKLVMERITDRPGELVTVGVACARVLRELQRVEPERNDEAVVTVLDVWNGPRHGSADPDHAAPTSEALKLVETRQSAGIFMSVFRAIGVSTGLTKSNGCGAFTSGYEGGTQCQQPSGSIGLSLKSSAIRLSPPREVETNCSSVRCRVASSERGWKARTACWLTRINARATSLLACLGSVPMGIVRAAIRLLSLGRRRPKAWRRSGSNLSPSQPSTPVQGATLSRAAVVKGGSSSSRFPH